MTPALLGFCRMIYVVQEPQRDPEPLDLMHRTGSVAAGDNRQESIWLTDTNGSKLRGNQGAGVELVIGRNWSSVEQSIGTDGLERGRRPCNPRRGAGADGWLERRTNVSNSLHGHTGRPAACLVAHLDDGGVLRKRARWLGRFTHGQVLDVTAPEDNVLKGVIAGRDGPVSGPVLRAEGTY